MFLLDFVRDNPVTDHATDTANFSPSSSSASSASSSSSRHHRLEEDGYGLFPVTDAMDATDKAFQQTGTGRLLRSVQYYRSVCTYTMSGTAIEATAVGPTHSLCAVWY
eukprot:1310061-Rhodomonas_salina.2